MFCYQCQETAKNEGCTVKGMCGKTEENANLQDLLIYALRGVAVYAEKAKEFGISNRQDGLFVTRALFNTITNANFDNDRMIELIKEALNRRETLKAKFLAAYKEKNGRDFDEALHHSTTWFSEDVADYQEKAKTVGVLSTENEDVRSLRELLIIGVKGIAAYADHAAVLGFEKDEIYDFFMESLASTTKDLPVDEMIALVLKAGEVAVTTMATLDEANTTTYGQPEITEVNIGVGSNPGILISGHDLKDMDELLKQTEGTGVDVYTHGEMLPTNYYPAFKKYRSPEGQLRGFLVAPEQGIRILQRTDSDDLKLHCPLEKGQHLSGPPFHHRNDGLPGIQIHCGSSPGRFQGFFRNHRTGQNMQTA